MIVKKKDDCILLVTQSFIVSPRDSYWDFRDYLLCLASNKSLIDFPIRLNLESSGDYLEYFDSVAKKNGFKNFKISNIKPDSWSSFMISQIDENPSQWTMPWPGDHIFIQPNHSSFIDSITKAESLGADAVAYGHTMDFEFFLDWNLTNILYEDDDHILIKWGHKFRKNKNNELCRQTKKMGGGVLTLPPLPGFATYRSDFFRNILVSMSYGNKRWQDMEYSKTITALNYKLLIPKLCHYRHVHGYWIEGFCKNLPKGYWPKDIKEEIKSWYIKTEYDWQNDSPTAQAYLSKTLNEQPYFEKYVNKKTNIRTNVILGDSPFNNGWTRSLLSVSLLTKYIILKLDGAYIVVKYHCRKLMLFQHIKNSCRQFCTYLSKTE